MGQEGSSLLTYDDIQEAWVVIDHEDADQSDNDQHDVPDEERALPIPNLHNAPGFRFEATVTIERRLVALFNQYREGILAQSQQKALTTTIDDLMAKFENLSTD